jgi:putative ABC transport system ATP-binding protein
MGPSGSGKSTLLNMVAGLDKPPAAPSRWPGSGIDTLSETRLARYRRTQVGMIFQFFNLLDDPTVAGNVPLPAQLAGVSRQKARARAGELLARLGIAKYRDTYPGRLSGEQRQRVVIARALRPGTSGPLAALISLRGVTKRYDGTGHPAVDAVSLEAGMRQRTESAGFP